MTHNGGRRARGAAVGLLVLGLGGCAEPKSEIEQQREAAADAAEKEVLRSPLAQLPRTGTLTLADRKAWQALLEWPASCEESFQMSRASDDGGLMFHALDIGLSTVEVLCAAGAYQPSHLFLRFDERGSSPVATVLEFPVLESEDGKKVTQSTETELFGETTFSADGRSLSVLSVARQIGDCGIWSRYTIGTEHPRLSAAAAQLPCPAAPGAAANWSGGNAPTGWRALETVGRNP